MENEKTNLYLLSIVGIVAVVGIVVLVLNTGRLNSFSLGDNDVTGQALSIEELNKIKKSIELSDEKMKELDTTNSYSGSDCRTPAGYTCIGTCSRKGGVCSVLAPK
jgi:hypothetical protein